MHLNFEKQYIEELCRIKGLNGKKGLELIDRFGAASEVFRADKKELEKFLSPALLKAVTEALLREGPIAGDYPACKEEALCKESSEIHFTTIYEDEYPARLRSIPDAPLGLWHIGDFPSDTLPSVAMIGARECSPYGEHVAKALGEYLGKAGIQVISGMARGIDGISQKAAVDSGGTSFGILGCGVNICYPPSNRPLFEKLKTNGGIISEYPENTPAVPINFPPRNRIVSGLSDAVIVVEARQKSGTLITVDQALDQGKDVFVVPGRITDRLSDGCNSLIGQGANVFLSPEIFICELNEIFNSKQEERKEKETLIKTRAFSESVRKAHRQYSGPSDYPEGISDDEKTILSKLSVAPKSIDELCRHLPEYDYAALSMILMQLMIDGHVSQVSQGTYVRTYK